MKQYDNRGLLPSAGRTKRDQLQHGLNTEQKQRNHLNSQCPVYQKLIRVSRVTHIDTHEQTMEIPVTRSSHTDQGLGM